MHCVRGKVVNLTGSEKVARRRRKFLRIWDTEMHFWKGNSWFQTSKSLNFPACGGLRTPRALDFQNLENLTFWSLSTFDLALKKDTSDERISSRSIFCFTKIDISPPLLGVGRETGYLHPSTHRDLFVSGEFCTIWAWFYTLILNFLKKIQFGEFPKKFEICRIQNNIEGDIKNYRIINRPRKWTIQNEI